MKLQNSKNKDKFTLATREERQIIFEGMKLRLTLDFLTTTKESEKKLEKCFQDIEKKIPPSQSSEPSKIARAN